METTKEKVLHLVRELPSNVTLEDVMEHLYFLHKVERGYEQSQAGLSISHEDVETKLGQKWHV